jgi:hypothetical protein
MLITANKRLNTIALALDCDVFLFLSSSCETSFTATNEVAEVCSFTIA